MRSVGRGMVYKDPASIEAQDDAQNDIETATVALTVAVLAVIMRRLGKMTSKTTFVELYANMPRDLSEIERILDEGTRSIIRQAENTLDKMAKANDEWAAYYYAAGKKEQRLFSDHAELSETLNRRKKSLANGIDVRCRTTVIGIGYENLSVAEAYKRVVSDAATKMATGVLNHEQAVLEAAKTLSKSGLRVVYPMTYTRRRKDASGKVVEEVVTRAKPLTRDLYTSVSTNTMDTYRETMMELRKIQGKEFGATGYEISAHSPCAPDHEPYQGRRFSFESFDRIQSHLERPIVTGANCQHTIYPIILGIAPAAYSSKQIRSMNVSSKEIVTVTGLSGDRLTMTRYDASQYQRRLETTIRKANIEAYMIGQGGESAAAITEANNRRMAAYKAISRQAGLPMRPDRTRAYV